MNQLTFQKLAVGCFLIYCALLPGSTFVVALDQVPAWGSFIGGALLLIQGLAVIFWLFSSYGWRGASAGASAFLLAWSVEHSGETTGFPFGSYRYTDMLQPQLLGVVPIPITCAWIMVAIGAWQLAQGLIRPTSDVSVGSRYWPLPVRVWLRLILTATLVVGLDLQIETIATQVNPYWVWYDSGPYYGVPTANFIAWWFVGLVMAIAVHAILNTQRPRPLRYTSPILGQLFRYIPASLYVLSSLMFTIVNFARGFPIAGFVGFGLLGLLAARMLSGWSLAFGQPIAPANHQTSD
ncbi:MAG: carotenoid biosynthesis protein [Roseiflexaceae bacterium]|nr:carotenoid biosynthesis protein [Roseiflexaceae bacterium]